MANERYTENLVLEEMGAKLGENDFGYVFPQGEVEQFEKIGEKLKEMGGKPALCELDDYNTVGVGKAKPEYIVTYKKDKDTILVVECKKSLKNLESEKMNMPQKFAVDGVLFYAKHLKAEYNVIAVAVSGTAKENFKSSAFYWGKGLDSYIELKKAKDTILEPSNYLNLVKGKKMERAFSLSAIRVLSQIMHEKVRQIKISEKDKPIFIAGILIALQNADFREDWNKINRFSNLVNFMINAIDATLDKSDIKRDKIEAIKSSFRRIKSNEKIKAIPLGESGSLAWFIEQLELHIMPMMNHREYTEDALSVFYHEFIKYSATDGKGLGIVLTPKHLTHFMCKLGAVDRQSKVVDICCGSGSFLVTALSLMCKDANVTEIENIKKNSLYGVELDTDLYTLAITNMIIRRNNEEDKDFGESNIFCGDCFSQEVFANLRNKHLSVGLMNPPYSQKDKCELDFVERLLNVLEPRGLAIAVVPMSCAIGTKFKEVRERLFRYHTLKAVFSMPDDIFYPTGVNVCVMVWEAHKSHDSTEPTFFGYCKDDGFVKRKKLGRIDCYERWAAIEEEWLKLYKGKQAVDGKSALQCVTHKDEWLCEAYMKTNFDKISKKEFEFSVADHLAYMVKHKFSPLEKKFDIMPPMDLNTETWQEFKIKEVLKRVNGKGITVEEIEEYKGDIPCIQGGAENNGVLGYINLDYLKRYNQVVVYEDCLTVARVGTSGQINFQENVCCIGDKAKALILLDNYKEHKNKYVYLFLKAVLQFIKYKYCYGRGIVTNTYLNEIIKLPSKNGEPDWEYMEAYIKTLKYADRI